MLCSTPSSVPNAGRTILPIVLGVFLASMVVFEVHAKSPPAAPKEVLEHINSPLLQGHGSLYVFVFYIYDGALFVEKKHWGFDQKFALTLYYKRDISKQDFIDTSIKELKRYYGDIDQKETSYRMQLRRIMVDVNKGDRITAVYLPEDGLLFYLNGQKIGFIGEKEFSKRYINIWLHPNAHYRNLRKRLLGEKR